jgi:heat shock protein HslJ
MNPRRFFFGRASGLFVLLCVAGIVALFFVLNNYIYSEKQTEIVQDYKDATYVIDGSPITLRDGVSETEIVPDGASKRIVRYFGNELITDLNNDGMDDTVFLLTEESGGSGVFYYVVAAIQTDEGYRGSVGLFLGDRIAPQTTGKGEGRSIVIHYADRAPGESFADAPSVGKSLYLLFDTENMQFGEVVQNFEGEADPSRMSLTMKKWNWIHTLYNDGREISPKKSDTFSIEFMNDGRFSVTTDCNGGGGTYAVEGSGEIVFSDMFTTLMYCDGSQETEFFTFIQNTSGYHFTSRGELVFDLKFDSGSVVFR